MRMKPREKFFQKTIRAWYKRYRRPLPWRATKDPYKILVSEIMLQQTQVDRVLPKYRDFLRLFPTMKKLAQASTADVIRSWAGLGYNSRAVRLQRAVRMIISDHKRKFPRSVEELEALPGIGPYTARAVATFAFDAHVAAIDTNHTRVVGRYFFGTKNHPREIEPLSDALLPQKDPASWNHALMDFGALICRARPRCHECPLQTTCRAYPAVLRPVRRGVATERFFGSNRYLRGRIVDLLRALPSGRRMTHKAIADQLALPDVGEKKIYELLRALAKEGVIVFSGPHLAHAGLAEM